MKTPSGYIQQSPWLGIANKQLELMGRYMVELGLTPAARSRVMADSPLGPRCVVSTEPLRIERVIVEPVHHRASAGVDDSGILVEPKHGGRVKARSSINVLPYTSLPASPYKTAKRTLGSSVGGA